MQINVKYLSIVQLSETVYEKVVHLATVSLISSVFLFVTKTRTMKMKKGIRLNYVSILGVRAHSSCSTICDENFSTIICSCLNQIFQAKMNFLITQAHLQWRSRGRPIETTHKTKRKIHSNPELRTPKVRAPLSTKQLHTYRSSTLCCIHVKRSNFRHENLSVVQQIMEHVTR